MKTSLIAAFLALALALFGASPAMAEEAGPARESIRLVIDQKVREAQVADGQDGSKGLVYYVQASYQTLWFGPKASEALAEAARKYNSQFERHSLKKSKERSTIRAYGRAPALLEWGSSRQGMDRRSPVKIEFGYLFAGGSPYFCVNVPSAQDGSQKSPALSQSEGARLLFTRAQLLLAVNSLN